MIGGERDARTRRRRVAALVFLLSVPSCGSTHDQAERHAAAVASWIATAEMVVERCRAGAVPRAYAVRTLRTAAEDVEAHAGALADAVPAARRPDVLRRSGELARTLRKMAERIPWAELDFSRPARPRVTCRREELEFTAIGERTAQRTPRKRRAVSGRSRRGPRRPGEGDRPANARVGLG